MYKKKRVAVLFFGQPRHIGNRISSLSHRHWLRRHKVDYFGHVWYGASEILEYTVGENVLSNHIPNSAPDLLRRQYPGIKLVVEKPRQFKLDDYPVLQDQIAKPRNRKIGYQLDLLPVFLSQFYSITSAIKVFCESAVSTDYDFVVLSRYDNLVIHIPDLEKLPMNRLIVNNARSFFHDYIFIGNLPLVEALDAYRNLNQLLLMEADYSPEELKRASFFTNFLVSDVYPIEMNVRLNRGESILQLAYFWLKDYEHRLKSMFKLLRF